jgi:hypothetical protein
MNDFITRKIPVSIGYILLLGTGHHAGNSNSETERIDRVSHL